MLGELEKKTAINFARFVMSFVKPKSIFDWEWYWKEYEAREKNEDLVNYWKERAKKFEKNFDAANKEIIFLKQKNKQS